MKMQANDLTHSQNGMKNKFSSKFHIVHMVPCLFLCFNGMIRENKIHCKIKNNNQRYYLTSKNFT